MRYFFKSIKFIIIIYFFVIFSQIISCKKDEKDRYYNHDHGFSIKLPGGWIIKENEKGTTVMASLPEYSKDKIFNENINIVVNNLERELTIEEYNREQIEAIKKIKNLKVLEEGKIVIDQSQVRWFIYSYMVKNFGIKARVFSIIKNNKSYLITCIFENDNFENYRSLINTVILSFKFE